MICDRCGIDTISHTVSFFNTDAICPRCDEIERAHPLFRRAWEAEVKAVEQGDYNFPGIGLPDDLRRKVES